jgi:hypothetical protein
MNNTRTPEDQALINGQDRLIEELEKAIKHHEKQEKDYLDRLKDMEKQIESAKSAIRWLINS